MSFARLKAMTNASILNTLADAKVRFAGSDVDVPGIFKDPATVASLGVGMDGSRPTVAVVSAAVPADPADQTVQVDGTWYVIRDAVPDGAGMTVIVLELA
jgi:hypothetical protein